VTWNQIENQPRDRRGRVALTPRQRQVVSAIRRLTRDRGYPPTIRELAEDLAIAGPNGVKQHLRFMARKGWVTWNEGKARTLRLVGE
jgi:repressor LexA